MVIRLQGWKPIQNHSSAQLASHTRLTSVPTRRAAIWMEVQSTGGKRMRLDIRHHVALDMLCVFVFVQH